ncbi:MULTISPECIES: hypothetical protein [Streptomyces]|uniref:hypothetical protein n=1 Tax=Streptomyces TaxID=1883 RepID=UPI001E5A2A89|nr:MULTISPECIES: hypothetical protein [Streptomyces]UFQ19514.1 hypothetical protein J2N69_33640 [Streptomyces huasconensis]WCL89133.1 hypothetical protein PPN52_33590 [Streptomyces sp. JCM 35825]
MRTFLAALGVTLTVATLGPGAVPAAATDRNGAATGTLIVNGVSHTNPRGCYPSNGSFVSIVNNTDRTVRIYPNSACSGQSEGWLAPGGRAVMYGSSVSVD